MSSITINISNYYEVRWVQKERAHLDKASLLSTVKREFKKIPDPQKGRSKYSISDCMMNVCAIFGLKYPKFENVHFPVCDK